MINFAIKCRKTNSECKGCDRYMGVGVEDGQTSKYRELTRQDCSSDMVDNSEGRRS